MRARRVVAVVSGGLDSVTMAHLLTSGGDTLVVVSVDYGQRHRRELEFALAAANRLGAEHIEVDLRSVGAVLGGSALTDATVDVPDGHYTDATMATTVVPNRNAILLSVATGVAVAVGAQAVAFGAHTGDHSVYPDCRPAFVEAFERLALVANEGLIDAGFEVLAPFLESTKTDIVRTAAALGVPMDQTWSCYRGGERHCGRCGTCVERREAFALAGVDDPTEYEAA